MPSIHPILVSAISKEHLHGNSSNWHKHSVGLNLLQPYCRECPSQKNWRQSQSQSMRVREKWATFTTITNQFSWGGSVEDWVINQFKIFCVCPPVVHVPDCRQLFFGVFVQLKNKLLLWCHLEILSRSWWSEVKRSRSLWPINHYFCCNFKSHPLIMTKFQKTAAARR